MHRGVFWGLLILLVLGTGLTLLASHPAFGTWLARTLIVPRIPDDRHLSFDQARVWLWRGELQLMQARLSESGRPEETFVAARRVDFGLDLRALLRREIAFSRIELHAPEIRIVHRGDNVFNFSSLMDPEAEPLRLQIRELIARHATVIYQDSPRDLEALLRNADADVTLRMGPEPAAGGTLRIPDGNVATAGRRYPLRLRGRFDFDSDTLTLHALRGEIGQGSIDLAGSVGPLEAPVLGLTFDARVPLDWIEDWTERRAEGLARIQGRLQGPLETLRGDGEVRIPSGRFEEVTFQRASGRWRLDEHRLALEGVDARLLEGRLRGAAWVALGPDPDFHVDARLREADLASVDRLWARVTEREPYGVSGSGDAQLRLSGQGGDRLTYQGSGELQAAGRMTFPAAPGRTDFQLATALELEGLDLRASRIDLRTMDSRLTGSGRLRLTEAMPFALDAEIPRADLERLHALFPILERPPSGSLQGTIRLQGNRAPETWRGDARLGAQGSIAMPTDPLVWLPLDATLDLRVDHGRFSLQPLLVRLGESQVAARGDVSLTEASDLTLEGRLVRAGELAALFGVDGLSAPRLDFDGRIQGQAPELAVAVQADLPAAGLREVVSLRDGVGSFDGTWRIPDRRLTGSGGLRLSHAQVGEQPLGEVSSRFQIAWAFAQPQGLDLTIPRWDVALGLRGSARIVGDRYAFSLQSDRIAFQELVALRDLPLEGSFDLQGEKRLDEEEGFATLALHELVYRGEDFGEGETRFRLGPQGLRYDARFWGDQVVATGESAWRAPWWTEASLQLQDADLGPILAILQAYLPDAPLPDAVASTGRISIRGPLQRPAELSGRAELETLRVAYPELRLENEGPLQLALADESLHFDAFRVVGNGTDLEITGLLGLRQRSNLHASGTLNLAWLEVLLPEQLAAAQGEAELRLQVTGTLGDPNWRGMLDITQASFMAGDWPQRFDNIRGRLLLTPEQLLVDGLSATAGPTGSLSLDGLVSLSGFRPVGIRLMASGRDAFLNVPDLTGFFGFDLLVTGTPDRSQLSGDVQVLQATWTRDLDVSPNFLGPGRVELPVPPGIRSELPFLRDMGLLVGVRGSDGIRVDNNVLNAELRGDVVLRGSLAAPTLLGRMEVITGEAYLAGRTYTIARAILDFVRPGELAPSFDVVAETTVRPYRIRVTAQGTPDAFTMAFQSTPPLPEEDLAALVTTGLTRAQLARTFEEGVLPELAQRFTGYLQLQAAERLATGLRGISGLDVLEIDPQAPGLELTIGRRLTERIMLRYLQNLRGAPERLIALEYRLTDSFLFRFTRSVAGPSRGDVEYRYEIR